MGGLWLAKVQVRFTSSMNMPSESAKSPISLNLSKLFPAMAVTGMTSSVVAVVLGIWVRSSCPFQYTSILYKL